MDQSVPSTRKQRPQGQEHQPIFNVPWPVLIVLGVMIAVHLARLSLDEETGLWWLVTLAFIPARYGAGTAGLEGGGIAAWTSFVTHLFVHADHVHLAINGAWLLAFGSVLAKRIGALRFFAFFIACGIAGAGLFLALHPGLLAPVIGASGAIAGLMGGVMRFLFVAIDEGRGPLLREDPASIPRMPLRVALRDRRIVIATLAFVGLNLLALIGFGSFGEAAAIAWEAHLGGYFFGLLAFAWFDRAPQHELPLSADTPSNVA